MSSNKELKKEIARLKAENILKRERNVLKAEYLKESYPKVTSVLNYLKNVGLNQQEEKVKGTQKPKQSIEKFFSFDMDMSLAPPELAL